MRFHRSGKEDDLLSNAFFNPDPGAQVNVAVGTDGFECFYVFDGERIGDGELLVRLGPEVQRYGEQMQELVRQGNNPGDVQMDFSQLDPQVMMYEAAHRRLQKCSELPDRSAMITDLKDFARATLENGSFDFSLRLPEPDEEQIRRAVASLGLEKCVEITQGVLSGLTETRADIWKGLCEDLTAGGGEAREAFARELLESLCTYGTIPMNGMRSCTAKINHAYACGSAKMQMRAFAAFSAASLPLTITTLHLIGHGAEWATWPVAIGIPVGFMELRKRAQRKRPFGKDEEILLAATKTLLLLEPLILPSQPVEAGIEMFAHNFPNKHKWIETGNCVTALSLLGVPLEDIFSEVLSAKYDGTTNKIPRLRARISREARRWGVEGRREFTRLYKGLHTRRMIEEYTTRLDAQKRSLDALGLRPQ